MAFGTFRQRPEIDFNRMNNVFGPPSREFQEAVPQEPPPVSEIFGPPSQQFQQATTQPGYQDPSMQPRGPNAQSPFSIPDVSMDFETPENQSLRRFMALQAPQRGESSTRGKIGNVLMALGGVSPEMRDQTIHSKYHQAAGQYDREAGNLLKAAQIEGQQNQYAGLNAYRQGQLDLGAGRLGVAQTNAMTAQQRTKNAEILAGMKSVRVKYGKGGQPDIWYDSKTGNQLMQTPSGTMDPVTQYRMEQEGRADLQDQQDKAAMDRTNVNAVTDLTIAGMPARSSANPQSASQQSQQIDNIAGDLIRQNPTWSKWLQKDPETGEWTVSEANTGGWFSSGPPADVRKKIVDALKIGTGQQEVPQPPPPQSNVAPGGQIPPVQPVPQGQGQGNRVNQTPIGGNNPQQPYNGFGPMRPEPSHAPTGGLAPMRPEPVHGGGRVKLIAPDGREGDADPSKVAALIAKGYRVVQ